MAVTSLFIAADRSSAQPVSILAGDAVALGYEVLWNRELPSGPTWWSRTLDDVERADALVFALTSSSITSAVCQEQSRYALDLGKPVLPVLLAGEVSDVDLPPRLGQIQRIDYRASSALSMAELFSAIRGLSPEPGPPAPPLRPECPAEFALDIVARLGSPAALTRPEQDAVLSQLARYVDLGFTAGELKHVLSLLHQRRPDMTVLASNRLDEVEATLAGSRAPAIPPPPPATATAVAPDGNPPVRTLFLSYSRSEREIVDRLVNDLRRLGFTVWIDQNLPGGKPWWDQVLLNIRQSDAFVFAAGPDSLSSRACRAELDYGRALGTPIVRVDVAPSEPPPSDDRVWAGVSVGSYIPDDKASMARLGQALRHLSKSAPPAVQPPPPEVPATYLFDVQSRLRSPNELDLHAQQELLGQIRRYAEEGVEIDDLRRLVDTFQRRPDTTMRTSEAIAALREELRIPSGPVSGADQARAAEEEARRIAEERDEAEARQRALAEVEARQRADAERARQLQQAEAERQRAAEEAARARRSRRRFIGVGLGVVLLAAGGVGAVLLMGGDDEQQSRDSTFPDDDDDFTLPTSQVDPTEPDVTSEPETVPDPTVAPFQGVTGSAQVVWQAAGTQYTAVINTQGGAGVADVQFIEPSLGTVIIVREDLTLTEEAGEWFYVGSSPRFADGSAATGYSPDRFHLSPQAGGLWVFDEVCDDSACSPAATTPL